METALKTIRTFADKDIENLFYRKRIKRWEKIAKKALKILFILNAVNDLKELEFSFDARLHKLHGNRAGQYSVRINPQYRLCFYWKNCRALSAVGALQRSLGERSSHRGGASTECWHLQSVAPEYAQVLSLVFSE